MKEIIKNKKAGEGMPWWLALLLISAAFILIWLIISGKVFSGVSEQTGANAVAQKIDACKLKNERISSDSIYLAADKDGDSLPDSCDNCPTVPNSGDLVEDKDGDNFPVFKSGSTICCGNDGTGKDDPKLLENSDKYCETPANDNVYGPSKLINSYITPKKP